MPNKTTDPRQQAIHNLHQVLQGHSLDQVLSAPSKMTERDLAFVAELSYGLCRWYRQLDTLISSYLTKPLRRKDADVHRIMLLGAYQLLYSRIPAHAILSTSVELTRSIGKSWAAKLVNGILRRLQRDLPIDPTSFYSDPGMCYAQPEWLMSAIQQAWPKHWQAIVHALQQRAPMTLRLNLRRLLMADYLDRLQQAGFQGSTIPAVPCAVTLDQPQPVTQIPGFSKGLVSVQDAGAQLAAHLLDVQPGQRILDACAAPGGKTGHILESADNIHLTAVDNQAARLTQVQDNLQRLGLKAQLNTQDASQPPAVWHDQPFDRILLDVPCSATGVIRRHPDIRLLRRASDIPALVNRQAALLDAIWPCLKPGGKLLYVTCSILPAENQDQMTHFLQHHPDAMALPLPDSWGHACFVGRQILPGEHDMDGFFYALLIKTSDSCQDSVQAHRRAPLQRIT